MVALKPGFRIHGFSFENGFRQIRVDRHGTHRFVRQEVGMLKLQVGVSMAQAMVIGWAIHGYCTKALRYFEEMKGFFFQC